MEDTPGYNDLDNPELEKVTSLIASMLSKARHEAQRERISKEARTDMLVGQLERALPVIQSAAESVTKEVDAICKML